MAHELAGRFEDAIAAMRFYGLAKPAARQEADDRIASLEAKIDLTIRQRQAEVAARQAAAKAAEEERARRFEGVWYCRHQGTSTSRGELFKDYRIEIRSKTVVASSAFTIITNVYVDDFPHTRIGEWIERGRAALADRIFSINMPTMQGDGTVSEDGTTIRFVSTDPNTRGTVDVYSREGN